MIQIGYTQASVDTFRISLKKIKEDTSKVNQMVIYARSILYIDPPAALSYCNEAMDLAEKINYDYGIANTYRLAGAYNNDIAGDYNKAGEFFNKALAIYKSSHNVRFTEGKGATLHSIGAMHQRTGDYLKAIEFYMDGAKVLDSIHNKTILPKTYNNLSTLYSFIKLTDKAEFYGRLAVEKAKEIQDMHIVSVASVTLSDALMHQGKYEEAFKFIKQADSLSLLRNDIYIQTLASYNYSTYFHFYKKDFNQSVIYARKAYEQSLKLQNPFEITRTSINLSEHLLHAGNIAESWKFAVSGLENSQELQSTDLIQRSHYLMGTILMKRGIIN
ncbi:MAG: tetratricopeptide repeat protein [Bacteroidales bacterium]|nr:tetratricopeptide repeat protein [Bacteroidales bacterium]